MAASALAPALSPRGAIEGFIQTLQNEWAYGRIYGSSAERASALPLFLDRYNFRRPRGSLNHRPPASRLTNVAGNYIQATP
jgi:transposase InsO family protein